MDEKEKIKLKRLVKELGAIKGRHTELVTVYVPAGFNIYDMISTLKSEQNTASNIKSKSVRKNVVSALEKIVAHLGLYRKTPERGIAVFSGNVSEKEGGTDIRLWSIEPSEPLHAKLYWCSQQFDMGPLNEMVAEKEIYGIICLDSSEANIALLSGKKIESIAQMDSIVPGKTRAGGQCLTPDALVMQPDGNIIPIEELSGGSLVTADFGSFKIKASNMMDKWETEKDETYRVVTKLPRLEVRCSKDHLFFVRSENGIQMKAAEELREGDYLLMPERIRIVGTEQRLETWDCYQYAISGEGRHILKHIRLQKRMLQRDVAKAIGVHQVAISKVENGERNFKLRYLIPLCKLLGLEPSNFVSQHCMHIGGIDLPSTLTPELARAIGYFIGDGNFEADRICFSEQRKEVAEWYFTFLQKLFKASASLRYRENKNYWQIRVYGRPLVRLFRKLVKDKHSIPELVLRSPDNVLAAFLAGLFDAEGYVSSAAIALGSQSEKLLRQLQIAFLRFGILSGLHEYDSRKNPYSKKHRFTVRLCDRESVATFVEHMGFTSTEKNSKAASLAIASGISYVRRILPSGQEIYRLLQRYGLSTQDFPSVGTGGFFRGEKQMSKLAFRRSILERAPEQLKNELRAILEREIIPVKIAHIEKMIGPVKMIDISVANENFTANGLIVHNSSARFSRVREGLLQDWFKRIAETANKAFMGNKDLIGILVSGPGPIKEYFLREELLYTDVRKKILGTVDTSYTGSFGVEETVERGTELLKEASVVKEKNLIARLLTEIQKPHGLAVYGFEATLKALEGGTLQEMIFSESAKYKQVEFECGHKQFMPSDKKPELCPVEQVIKRVNYEHDAIDALEEIAANFSTKVSLVSADTREGQQFLALGGIGGFLRFRA